MEKRRVNSLSEEPFVSLIVPCRNEERYIERVLRNLIQQDYPPDKLEIIVVDGMSNDKTPGILKKWDIKYKHIQVLENPEKVVPFALNKGIRQSRGEVIIRIDAHSEYPVNYVSVLVKKLFELEADNVGGSWITLPSRDTMEANLIAECTSNSFGIGNAYYRLGTEKIRKVDTVPYGCYKREVFEKIGLFDTDLVRNQDDEFNARLIKAGGTIYLIPRLKIKYYAREKLSKMIRMFFQFGFFKPLVNLKIRKPATVRQFFPFFFALFIIALIVMPVISQTLFYAGLFVLFIYFIFGAAFSVQTVMKKQNAAYLFLMPFVFFLIHFSYGIGYFSGIIRFTILRNKKIKPIDANR